MTQKKNDWIFYDEKSICHFRVAGLLIRDDKLFVQREIAPNICALPGGHVSFGETAAATLVREFKEEAGVSVAVGRLVWVEENFWKWGKKDAHGINLYFLVELNNDADLPDDYSQVMKDNSDVMMQWITFKDLQHITIYPEYIKEKVMNLPSDVEHMVRRDW